MAKAGASSTPVELTPPEHLSSNPDVATELDRDPESPVVRSIRLDALSVQRKIYWANATMAGALTGLATSVHQASELAGDGKWGTFATAIAAAVTTTVTGLWTKSRLLYAEAGLLAAQLTDKAIEGARLADDMHEEAMRRLGDIRSHNPSVRRERARAVVGSIVAVMRTDAKDRDVHLEGIVKQAALWLHQRKIHPEDLKSVRLEYHNMDDEALHFALGVVAPKSPLRKLLVQYPIDQSFADKENKELAEIATEQALIIRRPASDFSSVSMLRSFGAITPR